MKRLTDKRLAIPPGQWQEVTHEEARELKEIPVPSMRELYYRLSRVEDILCDGTDEYDLDRLAALCNQRMTMRDEVSQRFSLTAKIPLDRLREIAEAERDGRCVVLPCKFGNTVYSIRHERVPDDDYRMSFHIEMRIVSQKFGLIHADCIGKSVFLTRAEAEAALAKLNSET